MYEITVETCAICPSCEADVLRIYRLKQGTTNKIFFSWSESERSDRAVGVKQKCLACGYVEYLK